MPPGRRDPSIERTDEYEEFMKKLQEYHEKRGTTLDPTPKVGVHRLDLLRLYKRVVEEGGYDLCSDTKEKPLMWRKFAEEFLGRSPHLAAQAFQVKSAYYKNLVAYEITNHWNKEPPPKEILEEVTAKGGGVMGRTLENFERGPTRETQNLVNGNSSDSEEPEQTPKQEKMDVDEPGSANGRSTRGLRHAPPQRVLFQPEITTRQTRNASNQLTSPTPGSVAMNGITNGGYLTNGTSTTLANYEPRQQYPSTLKPVTTPANNPEYYRLKRKQQAEAGASQAAKKGRGLMLPGTGFIGPNIYVRAQLALQSGLPEEEQYALHHLVKISHERGDKYRFDQFAGLAEALVNKVLQVSNLFYDINWTITYDGSARPEDDRLLDGINGTGDVLRKLKSHLPLDSDDDIEAAKFAQALGRITEAGLVLRNMVMLDENAQYISRIPLLRDYFAIVLNIKPHPAVIELQYYALETLEQLTRYYDMDPQDLVYQALLAQLQSHDRGKIVTSLRALARTGMSFQENKRLEDVPLEALRNICEWMYVLDEELRSACLDFLYQFTSIPANVELLVHKFDAQGLVRQLSRLLLFDAKEETRQEAKRVPEPEEPAPSQVPKLAGELIAQLLRFEEPERSSHWLRMCFQADPNAEMTQISLWQSYQGTFSPYSQTHPHLIAGDFIKNVSNTFTGAAAQVAGANKYVIKGIKPRRTPVDYRGRELARCEWRLVNAAGQQDSVFANSEGTQCGEWFANGDRVLDHILLTHLQIPRKPPKATPDGETVDGEKPSRPSSAAASPPVFDFAAADATKSYACRWANCTRHEVSPDAPNAVAHRALLARHIATHLPDSSSEAPLRNKHHVKPDAAARAKDASAPRTWLYTLMDEKNDAAGLPLGSALVLRNIARGLPRIAKPAGTKQNGAMDGEAKEESGEKKNRELVRQIFEPVKERLFFAMAHNRVLKDYVANVLSLVAQGGG